MGSLLEAVRRGALIPLSLALCLPTGPATAASPSPAATEAVAEMIAGEPEPQSFEVTAGDPNASAENGGMVGRGGYYRATVTVAPRFEVPGDGTVRIILDGKRITNEVHERKNPGGLQLLTWSFDLMDMDNPSGRVQRVTALFDNGEMLVSEQPGAQTYVFQIPAGANAMQSFEVVWAWGANEQTLLFDGYEAPARNWLIWLLLLIPAGALAWFFWPKGGPRGGGNKPKEPEEREDEQKPGYKLSFPDIDDDRPQQLLSAHELAADANGGDTADPRPRTRLRIEYVAGDPRAPPRRHRFQLAVRPADPRAGDDGKPVPRAQLYSKGQPIDPSRWFGLTSGKPAMLELRCDPRAEGWEVAPIDPAAAAATPPAGSEADPTDAREPADADEPPPGPGFTEIAAASFVVELIPEGGEERVSSPQVTIVHGAPAKIELALGPEAVGLSLADLTGIDRRALKLGEPVGEVTGISFRWPNDAERALDRVPLRLGADRLLPSGFVAESDKGNTPVPMGSAVLVLFTVRDGCGNPVRLLEDDGRGFYQPTFRVRNATYKGTRPFFVSSTGEVEDTPETRWVARPTVRTVLPLGVHGTLLVPASADYFGSTETDFFIGVVRTGDGTGRPLLEREFKAMVQQTPFAGKWERWFFQGDVEDVEMFLAELFVSVIPLVGDGRDVVIHLWKEARGVEVVGVIDRSVFLLALAGLSLDVTNIVVVGGATPIDAAVAALKTTTKLLRHIAKPKVIKAIFLNLAESLGQASAETLARRASRAADDAAIAITRLAEELCQRLELFKRNLDDFIERGKALDEVAMRKLADRTFSEFYAFGTKVKPYVQSMDIDKLQHLLALMGMALASVQLADLLKLFVNHTVDEVIDLLTELTLMDELEIAEASR